MAASVRRTDIDQGVQWVVTSEGSDAPASQEREKPMPGAETILIVDDDPSVLQVASKVLRRGGYEVVEAGSGEAALRAAEQAEGRIDLLLTDVVMPGMGGRELAERLSERFPAIRLLFMSAYTEDEVILQGVRVAGMSFIAKPFTVNGLRAKVREVLDHQAH